MTDSDKPAGTIIVSGVPMNYYTQDGKPIDFKRQETAVAEIDIEDLFGEGEE
jgi:hypothetical protein